MITYFIQHSESPHGAIKIGKAKTVSHRLNAKRDFPGGVFLLGWIEGDRESELKTRFRHDATLKSGSTGGTEWFHPTIELCSLILEIANTDVLSRRRLRSVIRKLASSPAKARQVDSLPNKDEDVYCTHFWKLEYSGDKARTHLEELEQLIRSIIGVECNGHCALAELDDDEDSEDSWDGPATSCPDRCVEWAIEKLIENASHIQAIGLHDERKELWVFPKYISSETRESVVCREFIDVFCGLHIAGWRMFGIAHFWERGKLLIDYGAMLQERVTSQNPQLTDAMHDWIIYVYQRKTEELARDCSNGKK